MNHPFPAQVRCRWYEQCGGARRTSADKYYAMAAIAGIVFLLAFGTSSVWVSLTAHLRSRRMARRHVGPRDDGASLVRDTQTTTHAPRLSGERHSSFGGDDARAAPSYMAPLRLCCACLGGLGWVLRQAWLLFIVLFQAGKTAFCPSATAFDPQSIFRRDAERRHCCGVSPANHLRVALAAGLSLVALVLVTLGRLSSFHALVGAYAGVAALLVASSCALGL